MQLALPPSKGVGTEPEAVDHVRLHALNKNARTVVVGFRSEWQLLVLGDSSDSSQHVQVVCFIDPQGQVGGAIWCVKYFWQDRSDRYASVAPLVRGEVS